MLIRIEDLPPGWSGRPPDADSEQERQDDRELAQYLGSVDPDSYALREEGDTFGRDTMVVSSGIEVTKTMADYERDVAAVTSPRSEPCVQESFKRRFERDGLTVDEIRIERFTPERRGDFSLGFHLTITASSGGPALTLYGDALFYGRQGIELSLAFISVGQPFEPALRNDIASKVLDRFDP